MDGTAVISADSLLHAAIILLYAIACLASHRLLLPRLIRPFNRLAILYLVMQMLVIALALTMRTSSSFDRWAWHLDFEWNIPSTLSSMHCLPCLAEYYWRQRGLSEKTRTYTGSTYY